MILFQYITLYYHNLFHINFSWDLLIEICEIADMKERLIWLDISKGIAIILMVLGHSGLPIEINKWIFSFHMPLFFIASGLTTNWLIDFDSFLLKKTVSLMLPFTLYSIIVLFFYKYFLNDFDLSTFLYNGWVGIALWFVPILYLSLILSYLILSLKHRIKYFLWLVLPFLSALLDISNIFFPWKLSVLPYAAFFIISGTFLKPNIIKIINSKIIFIIVYLCITIFVSHSYNLDMASNNVTPILCLTIAAFSGTFFVFYLSEKIRTYHVLSLILQEIGKETFIILSFSQVILMYININSEFNFIIRYALLVILLIFVCFIKNFIIDIIHKLYK